MKEYIVQVKDPKSWDTLHNEIINQGGGTFIPQRAVECLNERPFNEYLAHYNLTDEEASLLQQDPRISSVELQYLLRPGVTVGFNGTRPTYKYDQDTYYVMDDTMKNWGLWRCTNKGNNFGVEYINNGNRYINANYTYDLDGTGVDIVIVDTGVEPGHPEFAVNADGTGGSRVIDFDWHSLGVPGTATGPSINGYLGDVDGHGSNVASIAAGNTCGWASGAHIYSIRVDLNNGSTDIFNRQTKGFINLDIVFDLIKAFHLKKIADGNFRPTIVNASWGASITGVVGVDSVVWRGTTYDSANSFNCGLLNTSNIPGTIGYLNTSVDVCSNSGVIIVAAAGNNSWKAEKPYGIDYNNYFVETTTNDHLYYHRGSTPSNANSTISVGAMNAGNIGGLDSIVYYSVKGSIIDIWAPGRAIMGAYSSATYVFAALPDPRNSRYFLNKIDGTSQATPQVTGYLACILQSRKNMTTKEAKVFLSSYAEPNLADYQPTANDFGLYNHAYKLFNSPNAILNMPFNGPIRGTITKT